MLTASIVNVPDYKMKQELRNAAWEELIYLCVVELRLHIQRLQNLIKNRLQAEHRSFLIRYRHRAENNISMQYCLVQLEFYWKWESEWQKFI